MIRTFDQSMSARLRAANSGAGVLPPETTSEASPRTSIASRNQPEMSAASIASERVPLRLP